MSVTQEMVAAMNRLAKWRSIFAGWQLGTRAKGEPEADAVRDHREATLLLRAEVSALAALLIEKGCFTRDEFAAQVKQEAEELMKLLEQRFPGARASESGMEIDMGRAKPWMSQFPP